MLILSPEAITSVGFIRPALHYARRAGFRRNYSLREKLSYGVMVTLQILDLPFLVRIQVAQRNEQIPH